MSYLKKKDEGGIIKTALVGMGIVIAVAAAAYVVFRVLKKLCPCSSCDYDSCDGCEYFEDDDDSELFDEGVEPEEATEEKPEEDK